jgi:hypothetical protein
MIQLNPRAIDSLVSDAAYSAYIDHDGRISFPARINRELDELSLEDCRDVIVRIRCHQAFRRTCRIEGWDPDSKGFPLDRRPVAPQWAKRRAIDEDRRQRRLIMLGLVAAVVLTVAMKLHLYGWPK